MRVRTEKSMKRSGSGQMAQADMALRQGGRRSGDRTLKEIESIQQQREIRRAAKYWAKERSCVRSRAAETPRRRPG